MSEDSRFHPIAFTTLIAFHLVGFVGVLITGVSAASVVLFAALYAVMMFAITAGYHRYFSHRTFKTSRPFAFLLAMLAQMSMQRGVLWWAASHRDHHRFSDTERDLHSPARHGMLRAHLTWPFWFDRPRSPVHDLERLPELVWADRLWRLPWVLAALACYGLLGWQGVVALIGATLAVYHAAMMINSVAHRVGTRRYATPDDSRNGLVLALLTFGEGWHNNHHHYMQSARQGFFWWEIDVTWYVLKGLEKLGLVWDVRGVPRHVRDGVAPPADAIAGRSSATGL